jgi:hypothetical protein
MLRVAPGGEVATKAHGDGASSYFGQPGKNYDVRGGDCAGEACGEGEGNGKSVGEADDYVSDSFGGLEVTFDVWAVSVGRVGYLMHLGSVVQHLQRKTIDLTGSFAVRESFAQSNRLYEHRNWLNRQSGR